MEKYSNLKKVSIRGRVAFTIKSLENAFIVNNIINPVCDYLLEYLKSYTDSMELDIWEEKAKEIIPESILEEDSFSEEEFSTINEKEFLNLQSFYKSLPKFLTDLIDYAFEIAMGNLYGGTGEYSPVTYNLLLGFIEILENHKITIPNVDDYLKYPFTSSHGWGDPFKY